MWIVLATFGQFLNAVVALLDKYLVSGNETLPKPLVYAFYSCLLTGFWVLIYLVPGLERFGAPDFGMVQAPSLKVLAMALVTAGTFFLALVYLYKSLRKEEAVNVIPIVGAISVLVTFLTGGLILETSLNHSYYLGVIILVVGTFLVAKSLPDRSVVLNVIISGAFFGFHYVAIKALFNETGFDDGFFWSRLALVFFSLGLLLVPALYKKITASSSKVTTKTSFLLIFTKILAGIAAFLILKATHMGDVTVVQALDGLKFVFILLISLLFSSFLHEQAVKREMRPKEISRQVLYVIVISAGFLALFL